MSSGKNGNNRRLLVIDDNPAIHDDFLKIFRVAAGSPELDAREAILFDEEVPATEHASFEIDTAFNGEEGMARVKLAMEEGRPYAVAFVDMRMPQGWDGIETILQLWKVCPDLHVVICTAYAEFLWDKINARLGLTDRLVVLKKPFDAVEVLQWANALTEKWRLLQQTRQHMTELEATVSQRTEELQRKTELFQALVNSSPDGILVVNERGEKLYQNQQLNRLLRIPQHLAEGRDNAPQLDFVAQSMENPEQFRARVDHLYSHREETAREEIKLKDGRTLERYTAPVRGPDGTHHGRIWTFRDITAGETGPADSK